MQSIDSVNNHVLAFHKSDDYIPSKAFTQQKFKHLHFTKVIITGTFHAKHSLQPVMLKILFISYTFEQPIMFDYAQKLYKQANKSYS